MSDANEVALALCDKIAVKLFGGCYPLNVEPELLAVILCEVLPLFREASPEVQDTFIDSIAPLIWAHQRMQREAGRAMRGTEWRA